MELIGGALEERPKDGELLVLEGRARLALGELLGAQASLLEAVKALPQRSEPFRWLGEVLLKRGDPARAMKVLDRALAFDPSDRAISELRTRASRLLEVASGVADAPHLEPTDEPTVQRADLTEQLRSMTAAVDAAAAKDRERSRPVAPLRQNVPGPAPLPPRPMPPRPSAPSKPSQASDIPPPSRIPVEPRGVGGAADLALDTAGERKRPSGESTETVKPSVAAPERPLPWAEPPTTKVESVGKLHAAEPPAPFSAPDRFDERPTTKRDSSASLEVMASASKRPSSEPSDAAVGPPFEAPAEDGPGEVDALLHMLRERGLFEPPGSEPAGWAGRAEVRAVKKAQGAGTRIGVWLGAAWVLALLVAAGGWYGWRWHLERRGQQAAARVEKARELAWRGAPADLAKAELHLGEARELDPHAPSVPTLSLFVRAQRTLEDGELQGTALRLAIRRAENVEGVESAHLDAAQAVLAIAQGKREEARRAIEAAIEAKPEDGAIRYLAGRVEQHLDSGGARAHLEAAVQADSALVAPRLALAELRHEAGESAEALSLVDEVLSVHPEHLRARLWRAWLSADSADPEEALSALDALEEKVEAEGAATDRLLRALARARLLRRQGQPEPAGEAIDAALTAGATEPRLLAWAAAEALRAGRPSRALSAARTALSGAPESMELRKLLARIELARRDGRGALSTLAELDSADREVATMRARAALLEGSEQTLRAALEALGAAEAAGSDGETVEVSALRLRIRSRLGEPRLLAQARALSRRAPGDPDVSLALGEVALAAREPGHAIRALETAVQAAPTDAEAHYLLGRARRLGGNGDGAEESFRRAIELSPTHTDAKLALGGLLLDLGRYEDADALYGELEGMVGGRAQSLAVAGRLGRIEALTGLGRYDDAAAQLEALQPDVRELDSARVAAARLALARRRAGDALRELRPLATAQEASPAVLALYADALLMAGEVETAAEMYAAAIARDSGLPEALLGQAEMAVRSERGRDALGVLARLERSLEARVRPPSMRARMLLLRGRAHLLGGRDASSEAREALRAAVAIDAAPPEAHFFLGEALAGANSPEARAAYERYLELAPEGEYAARARRAIRR